MSNNRNFGSLISRDNAGQSLSKLETGRISKPRSLRAKISGDGRFAIALDGTASMSHLIDRAMGDISEIIDRITREANCSVEIEIFIYRDYDVSASKLVERSGLQSDAKVLASWLSSVQVQGGGANDGEAVEAALQEALEMNEFNAVLIAGDEPANTERHIQKYAPSGTKSAQTLAAAFKKRSCPIHAFVVGSRDSAVQSFKEISKVSGGQTGFLDGSGDMIDMAVMAMLSALRGRSAVAKYIEGRRLSLPAENFGQLLLGDHSDM